MFLLLGASTAVGALVTYIGAKVKAYFVANGYGKETNGPDRKI